MSRLTLLLLVDAFRPDYLRDAPFLRALAQQGDAGRLREPFGFVPRAAYFGGLTPEAYGYTNMFRQADGDSPFAAAAFLPPSLLDAVRPPLPARAFLDDRARARVAPYARYVASMRVPAAILPHLAPSETRAPWDPHVGYQSLFHDLDAAGLPWIASAWPGTTDLADPSDAGILADVLERLDGRQRLAFVHFQELDSAGHHHGPDAAALRAMVATLDARVASLIAAARSRFDAVDLLAFGDHGMVTVTRAVDVRPALAATGLVPGVDYLYFLDSTMVRLWYLTSRARPCLQEALSRVPGLARLDAAARRRHRIAACDPRNGHDFYLADPGVIVWPDFFSSGGTQPRGMHGYDPDCEDNQGLFVRWQSDAPHASRDVGVIDATALYGMARRLLGLDPATWDAPAAASAQPAARYTACLAPSGDDRVAQDMARVVEEVRELAPEAEAVVLTGSFGRGEGGVVERDGRPVPVNDYDILVVGGPDRSAPLDALAARLKREFGLDFLDIVWSGNDLDRRPLTMANFDLKYGSQVLWGDAAILDRLPSWAAADIPPIEALMLLLNRAGGILSALGPDLASWESWTAADRRYLSNQLVKAMVAVGDWWLVRWGAYDSSYRRRGVRVAALAPGAGLDPGALAVVARGYAHKLRPDLAPLEGPDDLSQVVSHLLQAIAEACAAALGRPARSPADAADAIAAVTGGWIEGDNARVRRMPEVGAILGSGAGSNASLRQTAYAGMPLLLAHAVPGLNGHRRGSHLEDALAILEPVFAFKRPGIDTPSRWEAVRGPLVDAWLAMTH